MRVEADMALALLLSLALPGLLSPQVVKIQLLRIPDEVFTRADVQPDQLRAWADYSVTFMSDPEARFALVLEGLEASELERGSDLRWGILFFDERGNELHSLFVDRFGERGVLDGKQVELSVNLRPRLLRLLHSLR